MRRMPIVLSGVLALQLAGAIALAVTGPDYSAFEASEPLIAFDAKSVKEIVIDESGTEPVILSRKEAKWTLPGLYDFPAHDEKVEGLLDRLADLKKGLPVTLSESAPKRFKLTDDDHERKIVLKDEDETLGEVLFGTSPSYRYVHARTPDDEAVYSVAFATYDAGTRPEDWMDRDFLNHPEEDIVRIELPELSLVRNENKGLIVKGLDADEEIAKDEVSKLVRKLARLSFDGVEGKGAEALARVEEPDLTVTLTRKDDATVTYRLKKVEGKEDYFLATSEHDYLFRVPKYSVQALLDATPDKLVKSKSTDAEEGEAETGETELDGKSPT